MSDLRLDPRYLSALKGVRMVLRLLGVPLGVVTARCDDSKTLKVGAVVQLGCVRLPNPVFFDRSADCVLRGGVVPSDIVGTRDDGSWFITLDSDEIPWVMSVDLWHNNRHFVSVFLPGSTSSTIMKGLVALLEDVMLEDPETLLRIFNGRAILGTL